MLVAVVEDAEGAGATLKQQLESSGLSVELVASGAAALDRFKRHDIDAAVVDIDMALPGGAVDGVGLIAAARAQGMWAPILVVTARGAVEDRVRALEAGADDYVVKPIAVPEIVARLGALGRRAAAPRWAPLACAGIVLGGNGRDATVGGRPVKLSPRERALLLLLLRRRGEIVGRAEILGDVFGYDFNPGTNLIDVHVAHLRRKLEGGGVAIETVRGVGFCLGPIAEGDPPHV
jgi:two-component system OmpR family response regulator